MQHRDDSDDRLACDDSHDRWLAMQSAYIEYRRASEVLEDTDPSTEDSSIGTSGRLPSTGLESQQRAAFERYLEARMEFLEFRFDKTNPPTARGVVPPASSARFRVLQILAVVLLCTTAVSTARAVKHVRALEASRDELRATLNQTRDRVQFLSQKLDASGSAQQSAIRPEQPLPTPTLRAHTVQVPRTDRRKPPAKARKKERPAVRAPQQNVTARTTRSGVPRGNRTEVVGIY
jgi:hypothetical protein